MKKMRIIRLTEQQIKEAAGDTFDYLGNGDFKQYNGQSEISVNGKLDDEEDGEPETTDSFADKLSSQAYNRYAGFALRPHTLKENDTNNDNVDDYYNNKELDTLSNGNTDDNLVKIPQGVQNKANILIDSMKPLHPKQQAIVLNKLIESFDFSSLPYSWLKELKLKINNIRK